MKRRKHEAESTVKKATTVKKQKGKSKPNTNEKQILEGRKGLLSSDTGATRMKSSRHESSREPQDSDICSRCMQLNLRTLLGSFSEATKFGVFYERFPGLKYPKEVERYNADKELKELRSRAILQRLVFDDPETLEEQCWICKGIRANTRDISIRPASCGRGSGSSKDMESEKIDVSLIEGDLRFRYKEDVITGRYRSCLRTSGIRSHGVEPMEFGISSRTNLQQRWLPIVPELGDMPNYNLVKGWLQTCCCSHDSCVMSRLGYSDRVYKLRLLHVHTRRLLPYTSGNRYIALSYLWGGVDQTIAVKSGTVLGTLPQTIEDAITIVQNLGYCYIWVDSVCIDQTSSKDKEEQIGLMDAVYTYAEGTIIALDSPHARYGIHGVRPDILPRIGRMHAQIGTEINSTAVAYHPILKRAIDKSAWFTRAWTYQEGVLSKRCIVFTQHQTYFTCNEMECFEEEPFFDESWEEFEGRPALDNLIDFYGSDFCHSYDLRGWYSHFVQEYVQKHMTEQKDALNAITGVLAAIDRNFPCGPFIFGLPARIFRWALLWQQDKLLVKHTSNIFVVDVEMRNDYADANDRNDFPSWSWCGWRFKLPISWDSEYSQATTSIPLSLYVSWKDRILISSLEDPDTMVDVSDRLEDKERSTKLYQQALRMLDNVDEPRDKSKNQDQHESPPCLTALRISGILLRLECKYGTWGDVGFTYHKPKLYGSGDISLEVDANKLTAKGQVVSCDLLLIAMHINRHRSEDNIHLKGILVIWEEKAFKGPGLRSATKAGFMKYSGTGEELLKDWEDFTPRYEDFWLV